MASSLSLLRPHIRDLGELTVRRVLPGFPHQTVGPFIFFDHFGPVDFGPGEGIDVRPHPHIGLATVTYLFEGAIMHRDSLGSVQRITPGDVNWMTAGRGIVHSERSPAEERGTTRRVHGLQTWVALPRDDEDADPAFEHVPGAALPRLQVDGTDVVVVAGHAFGARAPTPTCSDTLYAAADMSAGTTLAVPVEHEERAVYVVAGDVDIDGTPVESGFMALLPDQQAVVSARTAATVMLVGGAKVDGQRILWWNFVASTPERIEAAKGKWRAGEFGRVPGDDEFIPLPDR